MNVIIPIGGKGVRFSNDGYVDPKPLIKIIDKYMIQYVIDNTILQHTSKQDIIIFVIYNDTIVGETIAKIYPDIQLINIERETKGAAETLQLGIQQILLNYTHYEKSIIMDCDTFYTQDIIKIFNYSNHNIVFYTDNTEVDPVYSYINMNTNGTITEIKEKVKISNNANTGAYAFTSIHLLLQYCNAIIDRIDLDTELYTSCVIDLMIKDNCIFKGHQLNSENVFSLGTPTAVETFVKSRYYFLMDLDGTLVNTDAIYFRVWEKILLQYNITLTEQLFKDCIQGNNDKHVINTLLLPVTSSSIISIQKDALFMDEKSIDIRVIDGVYTFLESIKQLGHKCCIVTNCNRGVAEYIINTKTYIHKYIDFIISNSDCINGKPDPEPYTKAIAKYNTSSDKCFIFEDSKSGLTSARIINPKLIIGIETVYSHDEMKEMGSNMSIKDYKNFDIQNVLFSIKSFIETQLNTKIEINPILLKGGFIANIISFKTTDGNSYIFKYENDTTSNLSIMATHLNLYNREYYFYETIAKNIGINIPTYIASIKDQHGTFGIVLENLNDKLYIPNLNLNIETKDVSYNIICKMAKMHAHFWNNTTHFTELKEINNDVFIYNFVHNHANLFLLKWSNVISPNMVYSILNDFKHIQKRLSSGNNLTFIHGDIKSPNIFYHPVTKEPCFLDWQHCARGKGIQDLIFFIIESFDNPVDVFVDFKNYYYTQLVENGIVNYSEEEYNQNIKDAIMYIPFFTSVWFGTVPEDELIDKNFPSLFITKLFDLLNII